MRRLLPLLFVLLLAVGVYGQSPSAAVELAAADVRGRPVDQQQYLRYFSMYHLDPDKDGKELDLWDKRLRFGANSLSREDKIVAPVRVKANLWLVDVRDYRWDVKVWERLADAPEPYFHVQVVEIKGVARTVTRFYRHGGGDCVHPVTGNLIRNLAPGNYSYETTEGKAEKTKTALAPWLPARDAAALALACQTQIPVVRLDWWIFQAWQQTDRKAGYYDWLALGQDEKDFLALGKASFKDSEEIRKLRRANVKKSDVVHFARGMQGAVALTDGVAFLTEDYASSIKDKNALRLLEGDAKPDGGEGYITLPNGLFAFWAQNGQRKRVDAVPTTIASNRNDRKITGTRPDVEAGISCVSCHIEGLRSINNWIKATYVTPFRLEGAFDEDTRRLRAAYESDLLKLIKRGNDVYTEALKECNGMTPGENAKSFANGWNYYADGERLPAEFALELGITEEELLRCLRAEAVLLKQKGLKLDPILISVVGNNSIRVDHLEEIFALTNEIIARHRKP